MEQNLIDICSLLGALIVSLHISIVLKFFET